MGRNDNLGEKRKEVILLSLESLHHRDGVEEKDACTSMGDSSLPRKGGRRELLGGGEVHHPLNWIASPDPEASAVCGPLEIKRQSGRKKGRKNVKPNQIPSISITGLWNPSKKESSEVRENLGRWITTSKERGNDFFFEISP